MQYSNGRVSNWFLLTLLAVICLSASSCGRQERKTAALRPQTSVVQSKPENPTLLRTPPKSSHPEFTLMRPYGDYSDDFKTASYSPDGKTIAAGMGGCVLLWDSVTGKLRGILQVGPDAPFAVNYGTLSFSPDSEILAAGSGGGSDTNGVNIWSVRTRKLLRSLLRPGDNGRQSLIDSVAFSPDGNTLAVSDVDIEPSDKVKDSMEVDLWSPRSGRIKRVLPGGTGNLAYSPDKRLLACWDKAGKIRFFNARGNGTRPTGQTKVAYDGGYGFQFTPNSKYLVFGYGEPDHAPPSGGVTMVDAAHPSRQRHFSYPGQWVRAVGVSPDSKRIVSGGGGGHIVVWDVASGRVVRDIPSVQGKITFVAYSPDGRHLASGGDDGTVRIWDPNTGRLLLSMLGIETYDSDHRGFDWISYTPDGYYDCSPGAVKYISWRVGGKLLPASAYAAKYHRPEILRDRLK